jgi:TetR/AcrR family transcriptional repressor of nem operon
MMTRTDTGIHPRDRLIAAATALFHNVGYHAVGVQTLCDEAGVAKGSFYHFFDSKEDLTLAAVDHAWSRFTTMVIAPALDADVEPDTRVALIKQGCLDPEDRSLPFEDLPHGCLFGRLAAGLTDGEPALRARIQEIFGEWAGLLADAGGVDLDRAWSILAEIQGRLVLGFAGQGAVTAP